MANKVDRDRKRRILEHLSKSSDSLKLLTQKSRLTSETEEVVPVVPDRVPELISEPSFKSKKEDRKRKILNHINQSSSDFGSFSLSNESAKKRIQEHLRKSLS